MHYLSLTFPYFAHTCLLFFCQVLETYNYEDIGEVSTVRQDGLQLVMHQGGRVLFNTDKAGEASKLQVDF